MIPSGGAYCNAVLFSVIRLVFKKNHELVKIKTITSSFQISNLIGFIFIGGSWILFDHHACHVHNVPGTVDVFDSVN
jgi:hypothetical protein